MTGSLSDARCPDGSWSKFRVRRCALGMGHTGPHEYEIRDLLTKTAKLTNEYGNEIGVRDETPGGGLQGMDCG